MSTSASRQYRPPVIWDASGREPNYVNPETRAPQARIVIGTFAAAVCLFIGLRIYNRTLVMRNWGPDDCRAVGPWRFAVIVGIPHMTAAKKGRAKKLTTKAVMGNPLGPRLGDTPRDAITENFGMKVWAEQLLWLCDAMLVKLALLSFYFRVFALASRGARYAIVGAMVVVTLFYAGYAAMLLAGCIPRRARNGDGALAYLFVLGEARCTRLREARWLALSAFNLASDVGLALVPLRLLWALQMPRMHKLGLSALFTMGLIACICSALRIPYSLFIMGSRDQFWRFIALYNLAYSEVSIGFICACMPGVWRVFRTAGQRVAAHVSSLKRFGSSALSPRLPVSPSLDAKQFTPPLKQQPLRPALPAVPRATLTGLSTFMDFSVVSSAGGRGGSSSSKNCHDDADERSANRSGEWRSYPGNDIVNGSSYGNYGLQPSRAEEHQPGPNLSWSTTWHEAGD